MVHILIACVYVYMCVCVHVCTGACAHACACMWRLEGRCRYHPPPLRQPLIDLDSQTDSIISKSLGSSFLCLPSSGMTDAWHQPQASHVGAPAQTQVFRFGRQVLYSPSHHPLTKCLHVLTFALKIRHYKDLYCHMEWCIPIIPGLGRQRQRQEAHFKFKVCLVYVVSSRLARAMWSDCLQTTITKS